MLLKSTHFLSLYERPHTHAACQNPYFISKNTPHMTDIFIWTARGYANTNVSACLYICMGGLKSFHLDSLILFWFFIVFKCRIYVDVWLPITPSKHINRFRYTYIVVYVYAFPLICKHDYPPAKNVYSDSAVWLKLSEVLTGSVKNSVFYLSNACQILRKNNSQTQQLSRSAWPLFVVFLQFINNGS